MQTATTITNEQAHATLTPLNSLHRELLRLKLADVSNVECARILDISAGQVGLIVNSPLFVARLKEMQAHADEKAYDVVGHMKRAAGEAADTITTLMNTSLQDGVKLSAAKTVLALAGHNISGTPPAQKLEQYNISFEQRMREFDTPVEVKAIEG